MPISSDIRRFGRDLDLPVGPDETLRLTPTGDVPSIAGRENLQAALRRRILTSPGELLHRPKYGAGLVEHVELAATPSRRSVLANAIRSNLLLDPRVREVKASVEAGLPEDEAAEGAVTVTVTYRPQEDATSEQLTLEYQP